LITAGTAQGHSKRGRDRAFPRRLFARAWALLAGAVLLCSSVSGFAAPPTGRGAPLTVFAAASLKEALDEASAAYTAANGQAVRVSYAASSVLARQIQQGAPADVYLSADRDWMDVLQQDGLLDDGTRRDLLGNRLVLVAPRASGAAAIQLRPGVDLLPRLGGNGRLALAMTASVPAGRYAREAFTALGVWDALQPRVAETDNVRAALMLVARGEAPLGVVYATDARAEPRVYVVATFAPGLHAPIVYPVARVKASRHPAAGAFVTWLATPAAAAIFHRRGFRVP